MGRVGLSRSTRQQQLCFLNGRAVENLSLTQGLREGYHTALMKGQYPVTYLFIQMDPAAVDVNVHPAKREVRFRAPSEIRDAVATAVRAALEGDRARWSSTFQPGQAPALQAAHGASAAYDPSQGLPEPHPLLQLPESPNRDAITAPSRIPTLPPPPHLGPCPLFIHPRLPRHPARVRHTPRNTASLRQNPRRLQYPKPSASWGCSENSMC